MLEHGAYGLLLDRYYATEQGIPADQAHRLARAKSKDERAAVDAVLAEFFTLESGVYANGRADREVEKAQSKIKAAQENGKRGGRPKGTRQEPTGLLLGSETGTQEQSKPNPLQIPDTRHQERQSNLTVAPAFPPESLPADQPSLTLVLAKPAGPPDCPHLAILALWAEALPAMPQHSPTLWKGSRSAHLRARWRDTAVEKGWAVEADGLTYFRRLFGYIGQSRFLTGKTPPARDRQPFQAELAWVVEPGPWAKLHEGKYHQEAA